MDDFADPSEVLKREVVVDDTPDLEDASVVEAIMAEEGYTPAFRLRKLCQIAVQGKSVAQVMAAMEQLEEMRSHAKKKTEALKYRGLEEPGQVASDMGLPKGGDIDTMDKVLKGDPDGSEEVSEIGSAPADTTGADDYYAGSSGTVNRNPTVRPG